MQITPLPDEDGRAIASIQEGWARRHSKEAPRASGYHVSNIIADWMITAGLIAPDDGGPLTIDSILRMTTGFIWEDLVGDYIANYFHRITQIPVERDGIHGTLDALDLRTGMVIVEEYKATWQGEERAIQRGIRWWTQIKSYAWMVGTDRAKLRVLHMCPYPRIRTYGLSFTRQELEENWVAIRNHKEFMEKRRGKTE